MSFWRIAGVLLIIALIIGALIGLFAIIIGIILLAGLQIPSSLTGIVGFRW